MPRAAAQAAALSKAHWSASMAAAPLEGEVVRALVLDFLVNEGHAGAAEAFCRETGGAHAVDVATIQERTDVRRAVMECRIDDAVERARAAANDGEFWANKPDLLFHVRLLKMLKLVRDGNAEQAIACAREELAPLAVAAGGLGSGGGGAGGEEEEEENELLTELERAVSLLAFDAPETSPLASLLAPERVQTTASRLNAALLAAQAPPPAAADAARRSARVSGKRTGEPALVGLLRRLSLAQERAGGAAVRWDGTLRPRLAP